MATKDEEKAAQLEAKVEGLTAKLERSERENEALRKVASKSIEHGHNGLALENKALRAKMKAAAKKEGKFAVYLTGTEPFYNNAEGKMYPPRSVVRLPVEQDPSIFWRPVGVKDNEKAMAELAELDEAVVTAEEIGRATRPSDLDVGA